MTTLHEAAIRALEAIDRALPHAPHHSVFDVLADCADDLRAALAEPVQKPVQEPLCWAVQALEALEWIEPSVLRAALAEPVQEPVAGRAFLERILAAMEGVIDVADRKTDEFDALRSCVIDLTLMLRTSPPQRPAEPVQEPVQEPVAWMDIDSDGQRLTVRMWSDGNHEEVPLYTAPPQRKPLTDEEIDASWKKHWWGFVSFEEARVIARAIEEAVWKKNF